MESQLDRIEMKLDELLTRLAPSRKPQNARTTNPPRMIPRLVEVAESVNHGDRMPDGLTVAEKMKVGEWLRANGFEKRRVRVDGQRVVCWFKVPGEWVA